MSKDPLGKKESKKSGDIRESDASDAILTRHVLRVIAKQRQSSPKMISAIFHEISDIIAKEKTEKLSKELIWALSFFAKAVYAKQSYGSRVERRLTQLEKVAYIHNSVLKKHEALIELNEAEEQREEQQWPTYTSEEFGKIVENTKGLENADENKEQILYHIMEIETILEKIESKARATNREYEERLSASLRDICKIHEPSELSKPQIKCFTASLQALIEGWGQLNREKVKWIRGRLLEIGLTWLPVTEKAQKVIDEAKSSVK